MKSSNNLASKKKSDKVNIMQTKTFTTTVPSWSAHLDEDVADVHVAYCYQCTHTLELVVIGPNGDIDCPEEFSVDTWVNKEIRLYLPPMDYDDTERYTLWTLKNVEVVGDKLHAHYIYQDEFEVD